MSLKKSTTGEQRGVCGRIAPGQAPLEEMPRSKMTRHEQVAAEIDMHAEVLTALGQRLDLGLHRFGQCRQPNDALSIARHSG